MPRSLPTVLLVPVVLCAAAVAGGCGSARPNVTFYSPTGQAVATGRLELPPADVVGQHTFEGRWTLLSLNDESLRLPFASGPYEGRREGDELYLTLNAAAGDNNISLNGRPAGPAGSPARDTVDGWWGHTTFAGVAEWGTFHATRR